MIHLSIHDIRLALLRVVNEGDDHTIRQITMLLCLYDSDRTIGKLSDEMNVDKPVVTRGIDRLMEDGFAERISDPNDRRSVIARITAAGRRYVDQMG